MENKKNELEKYIPKKENPLVKIENANGKIEGLGYSPDYAAISEIAEHAKNFDEKYAEAVEKRKEGMKSLNQQSITSKERLEYILRNLAGLVASLIIDTLDPSNLLALGTLGLSEVVTDAIKDYLFGELQTGLVGMVAGKDPADGEFFVRDSARATGIVVPFFSPTTIESTLRLLEATTGYELDHSTLEMIGRILRRISIARIFSIIKDALNNKKKQGAANAIQ